MVSQGAPDPAGPPFSENRPTIDRAYALKQSGAACRQFEIHRAKEADEGAPVCY